MVTVNTRMEGEDNYIVTFDMSIDGDSQVFQVMREYWRIGICLVVKLVFIECN